MSRIRSFLALLLLLPSLVSAQLDCIVPTREEGYDSSRAGAEAVRRTARAVEDIVKRNALFMGGNEPVRVRTSISYYGDRWLSASVITTAYNKKAWVGDGCQVSKFADRGGGLSDGQIAVYINNPDAMLGGRVGDSELPARLAPRRVGELAGFPLYGRGDDAADTTQLREPATISGETYRNVVPRVDDPKGRPIVRVDAAGAQRDPGRMRLLVIPQSSVATDEDHEWQVASRNALAYGGERPGD